MSPFQLHVLCNLFNEFSLLRTRKKFLSICSFFFSLFPRQFNSEFFSTGRQSIDCRVIWTIFSTLTIYTKLKRNKVAVNSARKAGFRVGIHRFKIPEQPLAALLRDLNLYTNLIKFLQKPAIKSLYPSMKVPSFFYAYLFANNDLPLFIFSL